MKKIILKIVMVICLGLSLSSCTNKLSNQIEDRPVVEKEGVIKTKVGDEWLMLTEGETINVTSSKEDLGQYQGKTIKVKGMFSGSTLYVDEIEE